MANPPPIPESLYPPGGLSGQNFAYTSDMSDNKADDDMTPSEREQWLREHGILIETPGESDVCMLCLQDGWTTDDDECFVINDDRVEI